MTLSLPVSRLPFASARLGQSALLAEIRPGRLPVLGVALVCTVVIAFVGWSAVVPIAEVTSASGEILPAGSVKRVQHLEGGMVSRILVSEGDAVEEGQLLMELSPGTVLPGLQRARTRLGGLELRAARLRAAITDAHSPMDPGLSPYAELADSQTGLLDAKRRSLAAQAAVLGRQIGARQAEVTLFDGQIKAIRDQLDLLGQHVAGRVELVSKGLSSRFQLLDYQREHARLRGQMGDMVAQARRGREAIAEAESRLAELNERFRTEAVAELDEVTSELAELRQEIERDEDRVRRLAVIAPVRGIVQGLQTETVGGVIKAGSTILDIVPADARLQVEARIPAKTIGNVVVGQPVAVKVATYDYTRYGSIPGEIVTLSPSSFQDEEGVPYYRARIRLDRGYVGGDAARNPVSSGMTVLADIRTGERTLMEYLLKPVHHALSEALHES